MKPLIKKGCGPNRNRTDICSLGGCCSILLNYGTLCPTLRALFLLTLYKTIYPHGRERSRTRTCMIGVFLRLSLSSFFNHVAVTFSIIRY